MPLSQSVASRHTVLQVHCCTEASCNIGSRVRHAEQLTRFAEQALATVLFVRWALRAAFFMFVSVNVTVAGSLCWSCIAQALSPDAAVRTFGLLGAGATCGTPCWSFNCAGFKVV